jgi:hypothetical protein
MGQFDAMQAPPRKPVFGAIADALGALNEYANKPDKAMPGGLSNPPLSMLASALSLPSLAKTADRMSYGEPLTNSKTANVPFFKPETADALMMAPISPRGALAAVSGGLGDAGAARAIFAGITAKTADKAALSQAEKLAASGADPRAIWKETGWMKGGDGKWRFEIDDSAAKNHFTPPDVTKLKDMNNGEWITPDDFMRKYPNTDAALQMRINNTMRAEHLSSESPTLSMTFPHAKLLEAYPDMYRTRTVMSNRTPVGEGGYSADHDAVILGPNKGSNADSVLLHELQHAVQRREGMSQGGTPDDMLLILDDLAAKKKAEARALFDLSSRNDPLAPGDIVKPGARRRGLEAERKAQELAGLSSRIGEFGDGYAHRAYQSLAGEAEARAVQSRMKLTPQQRRELFPLDSYDVPIGGLIYR